MSCGNCGPALWLQDSDGLWMDYTPYELFDNPFDKGNSPRMTADIHMDYTGFDATEIDLALLCHLPSLRFAYIYGLILTRAVDGQLSKRLGMFVLRIKRDAGIANDPLRHPLGPFLYKKKFVLG